MLCCTGIVAHSQHTLLHKSVGSILNENVWSVWELVNENCIGTVDLEKKT